MQAKKLLPFLLSATAFAFGVSGCSDYDNDLTVEQIQYRENFLNTFGKIDPEQDWNIATRACVTVTTSAPTNVKIYAKTDGTYRIVADYDNVNGTKQLGFDMREDVTELVVTNGSESHYVKPGDNVTFGASTRAIYTADKGANQAGVKAEEYAEFDADLYVGAVVKTGTGILPEEEANLDKVTQNFSYISNGPFTIHPIYWNSSSSHVLGVYWKEGNEYHYQDVYKDMDAPAKDLATRKLTYSGECTHYWKEPSIGDKCSNNHTIYKITKDGEGISHFWYKTQEPCYETWGCDEGFMCQTHGKITHLSSGGGRFHDGEAECTCGLDKFGIEYHEGDVCPTHGAIKHIEYGIRYTIVTPNYTGIGGTKANESGMVYSKGITIDLPAGTLFGFYLKVYISGTYYHTLYSQGELNEKMKGDFFDKVKFPTQTNVCKVVYNNGLNTENSNAWAATFQTKVNGETVQYLCFEDWSYNLTDLNDLVFATPVTAGYTPPSIVDEDADTWIICAEDLGNTFDLDYNDVVVEVSHVSGKDKATITPVAAGGTLASYIYFNNGSEDKCLGEIHELLGQSNTTSGDYYPFNVNGSVNTSYCKNIEVSVNSDWSIASSTVGDANFTGSNAMGGFYVKVVPAGTASTAANASVSGQKIQNKFVSGQDNVPYVFCVPREWERTEGSTKYSSRFRWSKELTPMSALSGYSNPSYNTTGHSFAEWVTDHTAATDWYKYPLLSSTMGIKGITETPVSVSPGDEPDPTPGPTGNDYSSLGTLVSVDTETIQYANLIATSSLPNGGNVTITYVFSMEGNTFVNIQNPTIKGKHWNDSNQYTQYWEDIALGDVTVSNVIDGNPDYVTISIVVDASAYASCTYVNFAASYSNCTLIGAYYK